MASASPYQEPKISTLITQAKLIQTVDSRKEALGRMIQICVKAGDYFHLISLNQDGELPLESRRLAENLILDAVIARSELIATKTGDPNQPFLAVACNERLLTSIRESAAETLLKRLENDEQGLLALAVRECFPLDHKLEATRMVVGIHVAAQDIAKLADLADIDGLPYPARLVVQAALVRLASDQGEYLALAKMTSAEILAPVIPVLVEALDPAANNALSKPDIMIDFPLLTRMSRDPLLKDSTRQRALSLITEAVPSTSECREAVANMERRSPTASDVVPRSTIPACSRLRRSL